MDIYLKRHNKTDNGVAGFISIDGMFECYTLELPDKDNQRKVSCIPIGKYEILERKEPTDMTMRYREKYGWFNFHLCLQKVKDRSGIYIHVGNTIKDSYGCILLGQQINTELFLSSSRKAFNAFYNKVTSALKQDEKVIITIE